MTFSLDGHAAEDRGFLRQVADAHAGALVHRLGGDVLAVEDDRAVVGRDQAGDHVEAGGLAGAVGAQQARHLAAAQAQGDVLDHRAAAERLADLSTTRPSRRRRPGRRHGRWAAHAPSRPQRLTGGAAGARGWRCPGIEHAAHAARLAAALDRGLHLDLAGLDLDGQAVAAGDVLALHGDDVAGHDDGVGVGGRRWRCRRARSARASRNRRRPGPRAGRSRRSGSGRLCAATPGRGLGVDVDDPGAQAGRVLQGLGVAAPDRQAAGC